MQKPWKRWLLSLGVVTGGRLKEICQLTPGDVITMKSGLVAIHTNETGEGKSIKNKQSERLVPLTDGAYGFDLAAFLRYVDDKSRILNEPTLRNEGSTSFKCRFDFSIVSIALCSSKDAIPAFNPVSLG
ncbi:hypothetical protein METHP14_420010 [Pseudomonas sp. P14-2025]